MTQTIYQDVLLCKALLPSYKVTAQNMVKSKIIIRQLYLTCILPIIEYANIAWCGIQKGDQGRLERLQSRAARLVTGFSPQSNIPHAILLARAGFDPLSSRRETAQATFAYRLLHQSLPSHLQSFLDSHVLPKSAKSLSLRNRQSVQLPRAHKSLLSSSPLYVCSSSWNSLPSSVQQSSPLSVLKSSVATL